MTEQIRPTQPPRPLRPNPLSIHPIRPLAAALSLAAAVAMLAFALGAPPQALARAHSTICRHSSTARHGSHHRACVKASHKSKTGAPRHTRKHPPTARARTKVAISAKPIGTRTTSSEDVAARCEDGSDAIRVGVEVFECEDGSEPRCEAGATLALSNDGMTLLCSAVLQTTPGTGEGGCADGSSSPCPAEPPAATCSGAAAPGTESAAAPACEEADEPPCEGGSSEDTTPGCVAPGGESDESAVAVGQSPAGPRPHVASGS